MKDDANWVRKRNEMLFAGGLRGKGERFPPPPHCGGGTFVGLWVCQKSGWVGPSNPPPPRMVKKNPGHVQGL